MTTSTADLHRAALNLVDLVDAAAELAAVLGDSMAAMHIGPAMTCTEAERIADVLRAVGQHDAAETWLDGHAEQGEKEGDAGAEDHHHGRHIRGRVLDRYHTQLIAAAKADPDAWPADLFRQKWNAARARLADVDRYADGRDHTARYEYPAADAA